MSYWWFHLLYSGSHLASRLPAPSPWVFPCDPPLWAAGLEHTEAWVHLQLELEWTQGLMTGPTGDICTLTWKTTFIFLWHIPHGQRPSVTLNGVSRKFNFVSGHQLCVPRLSRQHDISSDTSHLLFPEFFCVRPHVKHRFTAHISACSCPHSIYSKGLKKWCLNIGKSHREILTKGHL